MILQIDTLIVKSLTDTSGLIRPWYESGFVTDFAPPVLAVILSVVISYWINTKTRRQEMSRVDAEIDKLRKAFQPNVISTLQSVQEKVLHDKLTALRGLIEIRSACIRQEVEYDEEGQPVRVDDHHFYIKVFISLNDELVKEFYAIYDKYAYLFPNHILNKLTEVKDELKELAFSRISFMQLDKYEDLGETYFALKRFVKGLKESVLLIRADLHLDSTFIHEFIEDNRKVK